MAIGKAFRGFSQKLTETKPKRYYVFVHNSSLIADDSLVSICRHDGFTEASDYDHSEIYFLGITSDIDLKRSASLKNTGNLGGEFTSAADINLNNVSLMDYNEKALTELESNKADLLFIEDTELPLMTNTAKSMAEAIGLSNNYAVVVVDFKLKNVFIKIEGVVKQGESKQATLSVDVKNQGDVSRFFVDNYILLIHSNNIIVHHEWDFEKSTSLSSGSLNLTNPTPKLYVSGVGYRGGGALRDETLPPSANLFDLEVGQHFIVCYAKYSLIANTYLWQQSPYLEPGYAYITAKTDGSIVIVIDAISYSFTQNNHHSINQDIEEIVTVFDNLNNRVIVKNLISDEILILNVSSALFSNTLSNRASFFNGDSDARKLAWYKA